MADEVDAHAAGSLVVEIAVQAQGPEVRFERASEERRGLAATGVAGSLGAEEDQVGVRAGAGSRWSGYVSRDLG